MTHKKTDWIEATTAEPAHILEMMAASRAVVDAYHERVLPAAFVLRIRELERALQRADCHRRTNVGPGGAFSWRMK